MTKKELLEENLNLREKLSELRDEIDEILDGDLENSDDESDLEDSDDDSE